MSNDDKNRSSSEKYPVITLFVIMIGVMMSAVDMTAVVLGLPSMMDDLHADLASMIWVIMSYLLVITVLGTQVGKLGDMYGRVKMYNIGFAIFTFSSLLCGISVNDTQLIIFRVLQGIGGALLSSQSGAIIGDTFPENKRGMAYGFTAIGWSSGAILGILLGGILLTFLNWRYIFFINLPIGIMAILLGLLTLEEKSPKIGGKMDYGGMLLLGIGLALLLVSITDSVGIGWSLTSTIEISVSLAFLIGFFMWERSPALTYSLPLVDMILLRKNKILTASIFASFFQTLASFAVLFLVLMYLQGPRGLSPLDASLLLVPGYVLGGIVAPFAGKLSDRFGARLVASFGIITQIIAIFIYSNLTLDSSSVIVIIGATISGMGTACFFPANNSAVIANSPSTSYGVASGLLRTFSNLGMVGSFAIALLITSLSIPHNMAIKIFLGIGKISNVLVSSFIIGMHYSLIASIVILCVALVLSILRGKERRTANTNPA